MSIALPGEINLLSMLKTTPNFTRPFVPADVDSIMADGPAAQLGIKKGRQDTLPSMERASTRGTNSVTN